MVVLLAPRTSRLLCSVKKDREICLYEESRMLQSIRSYNFPHMSCIISSCLENAYEIVDRILPLVLS